MAYKTIYNDVIFIEGEEPNAKVVGNVEYKYGFEIWKSYTYIYKELEK